MKRILCLDTSSSDTLLCLAEDGILAHEVRTSSADHAVQLLSTLEELLATRRLRLPDLDAFAVIRREYVAR